MVEEVVHSEQLRADHRAGARGSYFLSEIMLEKPQCPAVGENKTEPAYVAGSIIIVFGYLFQERCHTLQIY